MRWFKHMTRSWSDEKIAKAVELGGLEAYGLYFRILEIVASNMENESAPECEYSVKRWSRDCGLLSNRFERLLKVLAKCSLLSENTSEGLLKVTIPNIAKYRDEYSVKKERRKAKNPDTLRTDSGQTPEQEQIQIQKQIQNKKKQLRADKPAFVFEIPEPLKTDAFSEAWALWQQHRKEKRSPLTPTATKQQLKKLEEMGEARAVAAIKHSIAGGYTGIFESKEAEKQATIQNDPNAPKGAVRRTASGWWVDKNGCPVIGTEY